MNIKNAFRYQNFLASLQNRAESKLSNVKTKKTETHQKSLANPDAADEVKEAENLDIAAGIDAEKCLALIFDIFEERSKLDKAIAEAKRNSSFDFDAELNTNKTRHELLRVLDSYTRLSTTEQMTRASDYKFNAEGNQISYIYPVTVVTELTYDKDELSKKVKQLSSDADVISDKADEFLLTTTIEFEPKFSIHDKFEDVIKNY